MKIMKKILCIFLVVLMCMTSAPLSGFVGLELPQWNWKASAANELAATGQCGKSVYWNYNNSTGELVISGTGDMYNWSKWGVAYASCSPFFNTYVRKVVIEEGVTSIGNYAFDDCSSLRFVDICEGVEYIGYGAFMDCYYLEEVHIPISVKTIKQDAFWDRRNPSNKNIIIYYAGNEAEWRSIDIDNSGNEYLINATIHYNSTGPDDPNNPDAEVIIKFTKDTYEVYVGEKVTVSGNVTCSSGIDDLELEWENYYPEGIEVEKTGSRVKVSENELFFITYIYGLKVGTYFVNLCDNNTTEFNSVKIIVNEYDEPYHPSTPSKPQIDCDDTYVESYQNAFLGGDWNTFKITGEITNYNEYYNLEDIWITIESPDKSIIKFDSIDEDGEKTSVTFPLRRSIDTQKSSEFKCKAYINRDYMPAGGTGNITLTCILHGKLNGKEVEGIYSTFNVKATNLSYKEDKPKKNKTVRELLEQMRDLVPDYESYYRQNIGYLVGNTGLTYDILAVESAHGLGNVDNGLNLANMAYDLSFYLAGITNPTTQSFGKLFLDQLTANTEGEVDEIIDYVTNKLKSNKYFNGFVRWCCEEYGVDVGEYTKYSNHCPTSIIVTDEFGGVVLKIIKDHILVCKSDIFAYVYESRKTFYLPTDIDYEIKITATDNGTMDYFVETVTAHGEKRVIEYNDIALTKGDTYSATAPCDLSSETDVYNLVSENGTIIKSDNEQIDHTFGDKDAKCKDCGYDRTKGCSCKCHKNGIAKFFFKIGLFFQKIFRTNKECKCGIKHY